MRNRGIELIATMILICAMMITTSLYLLHLDLEKIHIDNIQQKAIIEEQMKGIREEIKTDFMSAIFNRIEKVEDPEVQQQNFYEMEGEQL